MSFDCKRVKEVFLEVADLPDEAAQAAYLDKVCSGDSGLRARVEALLRSHAPESSFLQTPAAVVPDPTYAETMAFNSTPSPEKDSASVNEALALLAPAEKSGSLGRIGHYEVLQVLGNGGFGIVFRASDEILQRVVAVKVMAPMLAATSPARRRFLREAQSSAQVRHENVVQVYEVGEKPLPYLVMEFIPGETLQQRLDRVGPLDVTETVRIGRQIAEGLAAAHDHDLVHRDIKPTNVLLESGPRKYAKITDFGLARAADDASISQSGIVAGTPMYMAPEQAQGQPVDQRADLFSLGSVLYQMIAGRAPFRASNTIAVLKRVVEDTPRNIREIIPETPQWLCDIISKLHAKNPDERYQTAREVADVLADCEQQLKANSKLKDYSRIPQNKQPTARRFGRWKAVAAAVLLLSVIALAATELTGVTHLFRGQQTVNDSNKPGVEQIPVVVAKKETPDSVAKQEPPTFKNTLGMEFVLVPKGKSWLGGGKDKLGDNPVEIPANFYLGKYEVTQEEWTQVMGENPSHFSRTGEGKDKVKDISGADLKRFPVESVSWEQCQAFVAKLNQREKETGWIYRLPTEVEWEHACRGGGGRPALEYGFDYYFDQPTNTLLQDQANFNFENALNRTCKVGSYKPNRLGLYDMHGNVWELCQDEVIDQGVSKRVPVGGGWEVDSGNGRAWFRRTPHPPSLRHNTLGLRLARVPVGAPSPEMKTPPVAVGPFTDADVQRIAALPATEQVEEVRKELKRLNPGFDGTLKPTINDGVVTGLAFHTDEVDNIAPVRALMGLTTLNCTPQSRGKLSDISPLKSMPLISLNLDSCSQVQNLSPLKGMQLTSLSLAFCSQVRNLEPLKGMQLTRLNLYGCGILDLEPLKFMPLTFLGLAVTKVRDLEPLKGMKLTSLDLRSCPQVQDLSPLKDMPLKSLLFYGSGVTDLKPLQGMELEEVRLTPKNITQGLDILRAMKSLKTIGISGNQAWPAAEFWVPYDKGEFTTAGFAPFTDADVQRIAALPAAEQIEEARKELMRRNPGSDGTMTHKIENDVVAELRVVTDQVTDISPIRVFNSLRVLDLSSTYVNFKGYAPLADLSPLTGMNLAGLTHLNLNWTQVGDAGLVHFKDCKKLGFLALDSTQVTDAGLAYFKDCTSLRYLSLSRTKVGDAGLSHFKDCKKLMHLHLSGTQVSDAGVGYFKECETLTVLGLHFTLVTDAGLAHFKNCKKLDNLNLLGTPVTNAGLAHFKDCKELTRLVIARTKVTDLSLLKEMPLKELDCNFRPERDAEMLRSIKTLEKINGKPVAEFWKEVEAQAASAVHDTWLKATALLPLDEHAKALPAKLKERLPGFEDAMFRTIPGMAGDRQAIMVAAWLWDRNPAFEGEVKHKIEGGVLTGLELLSPLVQDLTPFKALPGLKSFTGRSTLGYDNQAARDAAVLQSLPALETINGKPVAQFWKDAEARQAEFKEWLQLVPTLTAPQQVAAVVARLKERNPGLDGKVTHKIEGGVVTELTFTPVTGQDAVTDLSPVRALAGLTSLNLWGCSGLVDLEPLKGLPLTRLLVGSFQVSHQVRDLEPLKGMKLTELQLYHCQVRDMEPLKGMPLTRLTLLSRQVRDCEPLKGMQLTSLNLYATQVQNLEPLKGQPLTSLVLQFTKVQNLEPLKDMPLTRLHLNGCDQVQDLSPLKGMPLTTLELFACRQVRDLAPLKDMPLTWLHLGGCREVRDLEVLKGMPLKRLLINNSGVTDLKPLQALPLEYIRLTPKNITQGLDVLRDMKSLKTIGVTENQDLPAAEFWERYDKGEFTK